MFLFELNFLIDITDLIFFSINKINDFFDLFLTFNELELSLFVKFERKELLNIISFIKTRTVFILFSTLDLIISI